MSPQPQSPPGRVAAQRDALLSLSRSLARNRQGGVLSDALDTILGGLGATRGAVYKAVDDGIEIVADRGVSPELRRAIERLPLSDPQWFIAQRAGKARKAAIDPELPASMAGRVDRKVLVAGGWFAGAAVPIAVGRDVIGVICAAHPDAEPFGGEGIAYLETAANIVALALGQDRQADASRRDGMRAVQTAQMAALGMLATGVADELRGPLGALALQLKEQERLVVELKSRGATVEREADQLAELTTEASQALRRAREITARLLAAVQAGAPEPVDLSALAREALASLEPALVQRGIALEASCDPECFVSGRREELRQTILNLVTNASDAVESRAGAAERAWPRKVVVGLRHEGTRVTLSVEDSGAGVPADIRARIFDPFFTTKARAIGIGLTLSKQTVIAHHGHVELTGSPLGGALFRIVLPVAEVPGQPAMRKPVTTPPMASRTKRGERPRILWIDDDDLFLRSMKRALVDWEMHTALTVAEGEAELALGAPEIVFCDVTLPDGSGHTLHQKVARKNPDLARRFVFVTGGVVTPEIADYLIASGCPTLLKPVRIEEILALLGGKEADSSPSSAHTLREQPSAPPRPRQEAAGLERDSASRVPTAAVRKHDPMTTTLKSSSSDLADMPRRRHEAPTVREIPAVKGRGPYASDPVKPPPPPEPPPEPITRPAPPPPAAPSPRRESDTVRQGKKKPD